jgi:hypothetical protein
VQGRRGGGNARRYRALTPLMAGDGGGGGLRWGFKKGNQGGGVKSLTWHLYAEVGWCGAARCGGD